MTTRVTEGARRERPLFLASRGSSARALPLLDLLTSRAFERVARSYEREARASERKFVPGPTTPDQKTMRTTLRKSIPFLNLKKKRDCSQSRV